MTTIPLTDRQKQVLDFIQKQLEERGYAPSLREIGAHLRIEGTRAVEKHVAALEKKGHLHRGTGARALGLPARPVGRNIPIVGTVAAGTPITAEENLVGHLAVDRSLAKWNNSFFLKVKGQSMKDAAILDGDMVLVKPQPTADPGDIIVAMHEGEAIVKRLVKKKDGLYLQPENPAFKPIKIDAKHPFEIVGKVMGVVRKYS